jgi:hypothetical protein
MSVKIMGMVWDSSLPRNEKFILLAYADHADHEGGNIYPAVATIAKKTGYNERMVRRITKALTERGVLILEGQTKYHTNRYRVDSEALIQCTESATPATPPGKMSAPPLAKCQPPPGKMSDKPSFNRPSEPSTLTSNEVSPPQKSSKKAQSKTKPPIKEKDKPKRPPAVDTYRSVANRFPDKATWPLLEEVTDLEFWEKVVRDYIACGWNKINIKTMLEFYKRRELPAAKKNGASNGYQKQSSITGLSKKADTIVKLADPTTGRTYWYDNINKCEVPEPL